MSEELRQKGYLDKRGRANGEPVGAYEGFNLGATTIEQLRRASIIPDRDYGRFKKNKPDGIVVDRRASIPEVKFLVEYKDIGGLDSESRKMDFQNKVAEEYCRPLLCPFAAVSDSHHRTSWIFVNNGDWEEIRREDEYPLDTRADLASPSGRDLIGRTLYRLETELDKPRAILVPQEAVNPTRLAEQTWQTIWLASGEKPEQCLATFVEILVFKFISDLGILKTTPSGVPVDFATVRKMEDDKILRYFFENVRPQIKHLFPAGTDGTSVINGIVLNPNNKDHGRLFRQILKNFEDFGPLRRIHPEFKSRIFERFLKKNQIVRYWGQYFTPRNVVKAMVEMSGIEYLSPGATVADPACGVGGFILEPLVYKRPYDFRVEDAPTLNYVGWDRDEKLTILAKANMLVYLSEILERDPKAVKYIAPILNNTFGCTGNAITGSLARAPEESFDLVLTNPPYVVKGSGVQKDALKQTKALADYYAVPGAGVENLFIQMIIHGLKKGARALVIVPDGLLLRHSERQLRAHMLKTCQLEAIISLPKDTFYSTPKKTYILVIRKKQDEHDKQRNPVFTYLVSNIGETLDARRFITEDNDLPRMAAAFKLFQGNPSMFESQDPRLKVWPIERFKPEEHWMVEKWWGRRERERLKDIDEETFVGVTELALRLEEASDTLRNLAAALKHIEIPRDIQRTITVSLGDPALFRMGIGDRVLKKELFNAAGGPIPLYSANVEKGAEHGWVPKSNLKDFSKPSILWSIDSDFNMTVREPYVEFATTDHCGRLEILHPGLDPSYCRAAITYGFGRVYGFDRVHRPSLQRMKKVTFKVR
jgi:type I restriction-modification system DNA methylase subunit